MKPKVYNNVTVGRGCIIEDNVEIGRPGKTKKVGNTVLGTNCHIRSGTIIYAGAIIGNSVATGHHALIREGNIIGNDVRIGSFTELALRNKIGNRTRIHSRCFLEDASLGNDVFVGPGVVFTNDPHPKGGKGDACFKGATVGNGAIIGGGVTVLPHIHIGKSAFIGAGSVVTKNVAPRTVVVGNPARKTKMIEDVLCRRMERVHRPYAKK